MASNSFCCCSHFRRETEQDGAMTVGSSSPIVRRVSPSKSKFSKFKINLPFFKKNPHPQHDVPDKPPEVPIPFQQNLQQQHFAAAGQQLIHREEHLFALKQDAVESSKSMLGEEEEDEEKTLIKDSEDFLTRLMSTIEKSFDVQTNEERESLKEAVLAIEQDEEQDRRWEEVETNRRPPWRPRCYRQIHDQMLQSLVQQRMEEARLESNSIQSSVHSEIIAKAKQLKNDLLQIARNVRSCYPKENVCQLYAKIYHQAFSDKLKEIAEYTLVGNDCMHVLQWVNNLYPEILSNKELSGVIDYEDLGTLLPDDILEPLKEQFVIMKESELERLCENVLIREKDTGPKLSDNCYSSDLAFDVIQCVNALLISSKDILGSWSKTLNITQQFTQFLLKYQHFLEEAIEYNQVNTDAVLKAHLPCIKDLQNYIMMNPDFYPPHIKNDCIGVLTNMRDACHNYFTKPIHKNLKKIYSKIGTQEWIKNNEHVCNELLEEVYGQIQKIRNLHDTCFKELVGKLHKEVLAEYVRKMMKKKIRFKDEGKQQQAAELLCKNSQKIHTLFTQAGSNMKGLEDILPNLANLLTPNDPDNIKLQLGFLSNTHSDLSEAHVSAWLYLKGNLSPTDLKRIKQTFSQCQSQTSESTEDDPDPFHSSRDFFSKVVIK